MNKLEDILTVPTACLVIVLAVMTLLVRRLVEAIWPTLSVNTPLSRAQRVWENFVLPAMPATFGMLFALVVQPTYFPYPPVASVTLLSRVFYTFSLGWFSSGGYRGIGALLKKKWNIDIPGDSDRPPPFSSKSDTTPTVPVNVPVIKPSDPPRKAS